jgi:hypothetical protein
MVRSGKVWARQVRDEREARGGWRAKGNASSAAKQRTRGVVFMASKGVLEAVDLHPAVKDAEAQPVGVGILLDQVVDVQIYHFALAAGSSGLLHEFKILERPSVGFGQRQPKTWKTLLLDSARNSLALLLLLGSTTEVHMVEKLILQFSNRESSEQD